MKDRNELNLTDCNNTCGGNIFEVGSEIIWFFSDMFKIYFSSPVSVDTKDNPIKF